MNRQDLWRMLTGHQYPGKSPKGVHRVIVVMAPRMPDDLPCAVEIRCTWHRDVPTGAVAATVYEAAQDVRRRVFAAELADNGEDPR